MDGIKFENWTFFKNSGGKTDDGETIQLKQQLQQLNDQLQQLKICNTKLGKLGKIATETFVMHNMYPYLYMYGFVQLHLIIFYWWICRIIHWYIYLSINVIPNFRRGLQEGTWRAWEAAETGGNAGERAPAGELAPGFREGEGKKEEEGRRTPGCREEKERKERISTGVREGEGEEGGVGRENLAGELLAAEKKKVRMRRARISTGELLAS